jgi:hypothetical protein
MENKKSTWTLSIGLYPGLLLGIRTYKYLDSVSHVLYIPFLDIVLTKEINE